MDREVNHGVLADYYQAKIVADETLHRVSANPASNLVGLDLRPGTLADGPAGKISLGKTPTVGGSISRAGVAKTIDALLAAEGLKSAWLDLLQGDHEVEQAVETAIRDGVTSIEGEPVTKEKI